MDEDIKRFSLSILLFLFVITPVLQAQNTRILPVTDISYSYIKQLQTRGILMELNPSSYPYTYYEIEKAVDKVETEKLSDLEYNWLERIRERIGDSNLSFELTQNSSFSDTKRLDVLRPKSKKLFAFPLVQFNGFISNKGFTANVGMTHSIYYDQDPDGLDTADRLYFRPEDIYVGYQGEGLSIYLGRYAHHWAPYGESSTILSDNARSFDHFYLKYKYRNISFESILGELDNLDENGTFSGTGITENSQRRYFAGHRIDWRPRKNFQLTYFESIIYSGFNSGISPKYLNPLMLFSMLSSNYPINDDINLLMGGSIWWKLERVTLNGQLLLDDIHFLDNDEVATFSLFSSAVIPELKDNLDIGFEFEAVAYQTYNAPQPGGRYLYLRRGLATQNTDYVLGKVYTNIYLEKYISGLTLTPNLTYYLQGEQVINQEIVREKDNGSLIDIILTGEVEEKLRGGLKIFYNPHPDFWLEMDAGYNQVSSFNNIPGASNDRFATILTIGFRLEALKNY